MNIKNFLMGEESLSEEIRTQIIAEYEVSTMSGICKTHGVEYTKSVKDRIKAVLGDRKRKHSPKGNLLNFHVRCACNKKAVDYEVVDGKRVCANCPVYYPNSKQ